MGGGGLDGRRLLTDPPGRAVIDVVNERGYDLADLPAFAARAGMPVGEFERHFPDKPDAVLRVLEAALGDFRARVQAAYDRGGAWPRSLRAAGYETARWLVDDPDATRFVMVSTATAGDMVRARRDELYLWGASLIDAGRALVPHPDEVPAQAGIIAAGAVVEALRRQQEGSLAGEIVAAVPEMMYGAVRPYLGEEAARHELEIPLPGDLQRRRRGSA